MTSMLSLWCLLLIFAVSIILIVVGSSTLPSTGGNVPQGQSVDDYQKEQQRIILASNGFVITMVGAGMCCLGIIGFLIKNYYETVIPSQQHVQIVVDQPQNVESLKSGNLPDFNTQGAKVVPLKSILKKPVYNYPPPYDKVRIQPLKVHILP
jgi:hypothetical protein